MTSGGESRRGITQIELLMAVSLTMMAMVIVFRFLIPAYRVSARASVRVEIQQAAVIALERISSDIQRTSPGGLSFRMAAPRTLAVVKLKNVTNQNLLTWDTRAVVYTWVDDRLVRKTWPPEPPSVAVSLDGTQPAILPESLLETIAKTPNGTETLLASGVKMFSFSAPGGGEVVSDPVVLTLRLERTEAHRKEPEVFEFSRTVTMRVKP